MCGLSGFYNSSSSFTLDTPKWTAVLSKMSQKLKHRGPDADGSFISDKCCFTHTRLSIIDLENGRQPMSDPDNNFTIVYNGEIYNSNELKNRLLLRGHKLRTTSDTEILLHSFMEFGPDFISDVDGIFAFSIYDKPHDTLYMFRDQLGVKPLYFTMLDSTIYKGTYVFASEIKALFEFPGIRPIIDRESFCEVFGLGPAKTPGKGVFKGIREVLPGQYLCINHYGVHEVKYWRVKSAPHYDTYEDTIEKTKELVFNAIKRQMVSDVPICTFLSGGLDSSLVSAVCAEELEKHGKKLDTFSFDFTDNNVYFKANNFQPSEDRPYVDAMVKHTLYF